MGFVISVAITNQQTDRDMKFFTLDLNLNTNFKEISVKTVN